MSQTTADPYAVLGVERDASQQQAARAYRRLAKRYHPDVRRDDQSTEQMRRLNQAWEILSSPVRRARYDADHPRFGSPARGHWSAPAGPRRWPPRRRPGLEPGLPHRLLDGQMRGAPR